MTEPPAVPAQPAQPSPLAPWYAKTPGSRPAQGEITVNPDHIINRNGKDFVLYAGLLDAAHRAGLQGISTSLVLAPSTVTGDHRCIVHATAHFPWGDFDGIGDADNANVSRNIAPHFVRMAETRAKARALRDALNVAMVAAEEMGPEGPADRADRAPSTNGGGAAPRPVARPVARPDGTTNVTSSPGTRKSYGTPMTRPPVQG